MAADPIVYCLENLSDYDQFERLCHDLMALQGYLKIEPLGGSKDKGRDAIQKEDTNQKATVFAYSVREDWKIKLREDAKKVKKHNHPCHTLVFLSTADFSATERDAAVKDIKDTYGWTLELYGIERLRTLLVGPYSKLLNQHPQIFPPVFVRSVLSPDAPRGLLVVDHHLKDAAFAVWLTRRLTILGFDVWCRGVSPTGGGPWSEQVMALLETTALRLLPVVSVSSASDPDLTVRRGLAAASSRLLPLLLSQIPDSALDSKTQGSEFVDFASGWASGLVMLTKALEKANCPRTSRGLPLTFIESLSPPDILSQAPETICSNRFSVTAVPELIRRFTSDKAVSLDEFKIFRWRWACRRVDQNRFLAFTSPPPDLDATFTFRPVPGAPWDSMSQVDGIPVHNVVPELVKKSIEVHYASLGLKYCHNRSLFYFPEDLLRNDRLPYERLDGSKSAIACVGQRGYWTPKATTNYKYFLAPVFAVKWAGDSYMLIVRPRIRLTDESGVPLIGRTVNSRRKHLCKNWWNDDWLHRILGIIQFGAKDGVIAIGAKEIEQVRISAKPETWSVSPSINEDALKRKDEDREEALAYMEGDDETLEVESDSATEQ